MQNNKNDVPRSTGTDGDRSAANGNDQPTAVDLTAVSTRRFSFTVVAVCGLLVLAIALVFGQTLRHDFVNYDDNWCVYENPIVLKGITERGFLWSLTGTGEGCMWGPVTWWSHMLDCQLYGVNSWGHHLTNVLLHCITTIALFLILRQMTGRLWPSAMVAALFAVHPLHVETVAWIAERKGLLGGLFFVLTLGAYVRYVQRPFSKGNYFAVLLLFTLGLMSKPVVVTLPFLLLLLDYWPLKRFESLKTAVAAPDECEKTADTATRPYRFPWRLLVEKIPLLLLAAIASVMAPVTQDAAVVTLERMPISVRINNALVSYVLYVKDFFYPADLAVFYPHPGYDLSTAIVVGSLAILLVISAAAVIWWRRFPYFFVGWFWYLGTLVPMIGLVQLGSHAMADRYSYITQIGLYIAIVWGIAEAVSAWRCPRWLVGVVGTTVVLAMTVCAWRQTSYWYDSESLWARDLQCTNAGTISICSFAKALEQKGKQDLAVAVLAESLNVFPNDADIHNEFGKLLMDMRQYDKAAAEFQKSLQIRQDHHPYYNLGLVCLAEHKPKEALSYFRKALKIKPDYVQAMNNAACILVDLGQIDEAIVQFRNILEIRPGDIDARNNYGKVLYRQGKYSEAVEQWRFAIQLKPDHVGVVNQLAWTMATCPDESIRRAKESLFLAKWATQLTAEKDPTVLATLAAAYAESGQFSEAVASAEKAMALASARKMSDMTEAIAAQLKCYKKGTAFREKNEPSPPKK